MHALILAGLLFLPAPQPDPLPSIWFQTDWFVVPSGPLPWMLPEFPTVDFGVTAPDSTFDGLSHGAGYTDTIDDMSDQWAAVETPINDANTLAEDWTNGTELPDMTSGDFDTGLDPLGSGSMNASEFASELGTNIGTMYQYMRLLSSFDLNGTQYVIGFIILCIAWMLFLNLVKFGIQIADMVYSVAVSIIELIPVIE